MRLKAANIGYGILSFLYFFSVFLPAYLERIAWLSAVCNTAKIIFFIVLVIYHFMVKRDMSLLVIFAFIYTSIPAIVTFVNGGEYVTVIRNIVVLPSILMWCEFLRKKGSRIIVTSLTILLECLIYINLITIILVPDGLYLFEPIKGLVSDRVWFFGYRTSHNTYLILGCVCECLRYYYSKKSFVDKLRLLILLLVCVATVVLLETGTGYVIIAVFSILMLLCKLIQTRFRFSWAILFHLGLFLAITIFSASQLFAGYFSMFGKSATMTGRTELWAAVWLKIFQKPLFGHGYLNATELLWMRALAAGATTSHNAFLDMLFRGGLMTFVMFILILVEAGRQLEARELSAKLNNLLICFFICVYLVNQVESGMDSAILFSMIGLIKVLPDKSSIETLKRRRRLSWGN